MRTENYIAFFTVCGFFIGLVFTVLKADNPIDILLYTVLITFFFYLVIHIIIMNYVDVKTTVKNFFDKSKHEEVADYLIGELGIRERRLENLVFAPTNENKKSKVSDSKNARAKAKAA